MEYSYKFRIYPNKTQENLIQRTFGCCRFVFNYFLVERMGQYKQTGHAPTRFQQDKALPVLKKELEWLREVDTTAKQPCRCWIPPIRTSSGGSDRAETPAIPDSKASA